MAIQTRIGVLCACLVVAYGAWAAADVAILTDGTRLSGDVTVGARSVTVRAGGGILTLPSWRVAAVEKEGQPARPLRPAAAQAPAQPPATRPPAAPSASSGQAPGPTRTGPAKLPVPVASAPQPASAQAGPPAVGDVLNQKVDVDFSGVSLRQVLDYLHEITGVNMAMTEEVRADVQPVHLQLKGVTVKTVLDLAMEATGFAYAVKPGEVLYVCRGITSADMSVRVYSIRDLMLSTEDQYGSRAGGNAAQGGRGSGGGGGGGRAGGIGLQFAASRAGGATLQAGVGAQQVGGFTVPLSARTQQYVLLVRGTCGQGTWATPLSGGLTGVGQMVYPAGAAAPGF